MMKKQEVYDNCEKYILPTYTRLPGVFVSGKGSKLTDVDGKTYLDFFPGWGVSNVGHCHVKVMSAVRNQLAKLIHLPNNLYTVPQVKLAKEIIRTSFKGKVFFCNSGAEANEAAIKYARAYGDKNGRHEIITTLQSFHGRTFGALSATGQEKLKADFGPIVEGFKHVPFNDIEAMKKAISKKTVAIMLELVQGEGGVNVANQDYIKALRNLCDEKDLLLIVDEVQTGMGRTGEIYAFKHYGIHPDIMTLAKGLGGGFPIGAMVVNDKKQGAFKPGMHGSTFAGGAVVSNAALGVFKAIYGGNLLPKAKKKGKHLVKALEELKTKYNFIKEVRGLGLMIAIELSIEGASIVQKCLQNGLIINCTQGNVLRIMPALTVTDREIKKALHILDKVLQEV